MRKPVLASATAAALAAGVLAIAQPAAADDGIRHVNSTAETCTDTGTGTTEAPFCTIGAAVTGLTAGQTVRIDGWRPYQERVTVTGSGAPTEPIVIHFAKKSFMGGADAGFVVDGGRHIRVENLHVRTTSAPPAQPFLELRDSSDVTVDGGTFMQHLTESSAAPVVRLTGVTESLLKNLQISGANVVTGISMDADTEGVTIDHATVQFSRHAAVDGPAIGVEGSGNTVLNTTVDNVAGTGILVGPGAASTVIANNDVTASESHGIHNAGARGTAITNNTVANSCDDGIRVDGAASGVSVQNNAVYRSYGGLYPLRCSGPWNSQSVGIRVDGDATKDSIVDYNDTYAGLPDSQTLYAWAGTPMSLTGFRAASGQAAHDREVANDAPNLHDSANSAAPGFQETDASGRQRLDDRSLADTGAGPIGYADRGAVERVFAPIARSSVALDLLNGSATVDASASAARTAPIVTYRFDFGNGTVVDQESPVASHRYATSGHYTVAVTATADDNRTHTTSQQVSVLPRTAALGLFSAYHRSYVAVDGGVPRADQSSLTTDGHFDLVDAGSGLVALYSRAAGKYVSVDKYTSHLLASRLDVDGAAKFSLIRNADGSVSLKAANGRYVAAYNRQDSLIAHGASIDSTTQFYRASVTGAPFAALKATKAPTISGTLRVGSTVKVSPGTWTPAATSYTYQWYANGTAIKGATSQSLKITSSMLSKRLTVKVTAKLVAHPNGTATSASSAKIARGVAPKATKKPTISGTPKAGRTVKVNVGTWTPKADSYKYVWRVNGKVVKVATKSKHLKLKASMRGKKLTVTVIAIRAGHANGTATSKAVTIRR